MRTGAVGVAGLGSVVSGDVDVAAVALAEDNRAR